MWKEPAKIKYNVIVKQYCEGGLKMVYLKAFINNMKLTWIRRSIISDSPWQSVVENVINFKVFFSFGKKYVESLLKHVKINFGLTFLKHIQKF